MKQVLATLYDIINFKTVLVTIAAIISTYLCIQYQLHADFPLTLVATAIVFPIVFSINSAYKRREIALREYAFIKSHGRAIFFVARDWLESPSNETLDHARQRIIKVLSTCRDLFTGHPDTFRNREEDVYDAFSDLSLFIKNDLRGNGLASGEVSRTNQYLSKMFCAFENMKHIYQYRTPRTLRLFSKVFVSVLPIIYGPYFAFNAIEYSPGLAYIMPILFSVVLVSLSNIQEHLENPFDLVGEDDIQFNVEQFEARLNTR